MLGEPLLALAVDVLQLADDQVREVGGLLVVGGPGLVSQVGDLPLGEDDPELLDLVAHRPESHRPDAGRIHADHAADGAGPAFTGTGSSRRPSGASSALSASRPPPARRPRGPPVI